MRDAQRWGKSLIFFHTLAECRQCQRGELAEQDVAAELK